MCLAINKPRGVPFDDFIKQAIRNSYSYNKDGIGFALKRNGYGIICRKAVVEPDQIIKWIEDLCPLPEEEMLIHLRHGTSGEVIDRNCHPFVITKSFDQCVSTSVTTKLPVMIHNGMFSSQIYKEVEKEYSDTYHVVEQILANPYISGLMYSHEELFKLLMKDPFGSNKVAIMFPYKETIRLGSWSEDNGVWFSNTNYKSNNNSNCSLGRTYRHRKTGDLDLLNEREWVEAVSRQDLTDPYYRKKPNLTKQEIRKMLKIEEDRKLKGFLDPKDLRVGTILEVVAKSGLVCQPVEASEFNVTMLRPNDMVKLKYIYKVNGVDYWKCEVLNTARANFSIVPIRIPMCFKFARDLNGDSVKGKSLILLEKGYNKAPSKVVLAPDGTDDEIKKIFNPDNWSRSKYKNFRQAYVSCVGHKKDKVTLKSDGKEYGPYDIEFVKDLIDGYEKKNYSTA